MSLASPTAGVLIGLYLGVGTLTGWFLTRRAHGVKDRITTAGFALVAWPLYAPIALMREAIPRPTPRAVRALGALHEAHAAVVGTPLGPLLPEGQLRSLCEAVTRAAARADELARLLGRPEFDLAAAERELADLESEGAPTRTLGPARVRVESARRLSALARHERERLEELSTLAEALRTQLVLARYAGSTPTGAGDIVSEMAARVTGLDDAMQAHLLEAPLG